MQTEKIAVTSWNGIVSPLCDAAERVTVFDQEERLELSFGFGSMQRKAEILREHSVNILICGALSVRGAQILEQCAITTVAWVCGPIDEVVQAYRKGMLKGSTFFMPGCGRGIRCLKGKGRRHGRHQRAMKSSENSRQGEEKGNENSDQRAGT